MASHHRRALRSLLIASGPPAAVLLGVAVVKVVAGIEVATLTTEATTVLGAPPYAGMISALGLFGWAAAVGILWFGAALSRPRSGALTLLGAITAFLLVDDAFTLHEAVLPAAGVPELLTYTVIAAAAATFVLRHRLLVTDGPWPLLAAAVAALGTSVALDIVLQFTGGSPLGHNIEVFLEDGAKLVGIAYWVAHAGAFTADVLRRGDSPVLPPHDVRPSRARQAHTRTGTAPRH